MYKTYMIKMLLTLDKHKTGPEHTERHNMFLDRIVFTKMSVLPKLTNKFNIILPLPQKEKKKNNRKNFGTR